MGMSASQARFLSLTARKNNVEFEGQQINQQRTTLSNESASYYSELCNMEVPTPPSIDDYTKVSYTFNDGAMTNTLISLLPKSGTNNKYVVNYVEEWQDDYAIVPSASSLVEADNADNPTSFSIGNDNLFQMGATNVTKTDKGYEFTFSGANGTTTTQTISEADMEVHYPYYATLTLTQLNSALKNEQYLLKMAQEKTGDNGNFYVRYIKNTTTGNYEPYIYAESELKQSNNKKLASIPCYSLGSTTQTREILHKEATVEKDSSGRYVAITIVLQDEEKDKNGNVTQPKVERTYALTTTTTTDEEAYNDAMNEYNYKQHEYDHKIQEINSKLEIVQQQDKQLELKLKQLDTEENAISTEMDAVKKVISKNVESSFKTFNA